MPSEVELLPQRIAVDVLVEIVHRVLHIQAVEAEVLDHKAHGGSRVLERVKEAVEAVALEPCANQTDDSHGNYYAVVRATAVCPECSLKHRRSGRFSELELDSLIS